jgi:hypothetical protein
MAHDLKSRKITAAQVINDRPTAKSIMGSCSAAPAAPGAEISYVPELNKIFLTVIALRHRAACM